MSSPEGHQLTYKSYKSMLTRCYCETSTSYSAYGAKGVEVCDRWQASFWNFLEDMGPRPSKNFVLSRNGDTGNYEPENTTWKTREENESERQSARGERQGLSKLKEKDILTIRDLYKSGQTFTEIAKRYKVARSTVARIIEGKTWTHVF
jgi:hypothetical protein